MSCTRGDYTISAYHFETQRICHQKTKSRMSVVRKGNGHYEVSEPKFLLGFTGVLTYYYIDIITVLTSLLY